MAENSEFEAKDEGIVIIIFYITLIYDVSLSGVLIICVIIDSI